MKSSTTILQEIIQRRQIRQDYLEWRLLHVEIPLIAAAMVVLLLLGGLTDLGLLR